MDVKLDIPPDSTSEEKLSSLEKLKKNVQCRDDFFLTRMLNILETEAGGQLSEAELNDALLKLTKSTDEIKIDFLFKVYDINSEGVLDEANFREIINACMRESGLQLDQDDLHILAGSLFHDGVQEGRKTMTLEDFKRQLRRHRLHDGLHIMITNWLTVPDALTTKTTLAEKISAMRRKYLCSEYWSNNNNLGYSILVILLINAGLFIQRAFYYRHFTSLSGLTPNPFYLLSRACGRVLMFNSVLVLALVLRNSITILRRFGLASVLPLDHNIYLHKLVGILIFLQGLLHSVMHFFNFVINIQPDPVKFVQLTYRYWSECYGEGRILEMYEPPPGCQVVGRDSVLAEFCPEGALDIPDGVNPDILYNNGSFLCQACPREAQPWTCTDWLLTKQPRVFGKLGGEANPAGVMLLLILAIIFIFSLPCIRRSGNFRTFYYTHMFYWAYFFCLLCHAEQFWKWILAVGVVWLVEISYRTLTYMFGHGRTFIAEAELLPSRVTKLVVERPPGFHFSPGDWVFVKIPAVASTEWHPFTISSAPEMSGQFTLHIRGLGQWTNSLYRMFQAEYEERQSQGRGQSSPFRRNQRTERTERSEAAEVEKELSDKTAPARPLEIFVDGPFGSPASNIFRAEHAVLISTGIGVTPFASILQSIMWRHWQRRKASHQSQSVFNLKKVDFFWVNRDQTSFEWFVDLLSQLEQEQREKGGSLKRFLDLHMFVTSAKARLDMKVVALQLALDILYNNRGDSDCVEALQSRLRAGRPDWSSVLAQIGRERRGEVTVFYCGHPALAATLSVLCKQLGFTFRKEVF